MNPNGDQSSINSLLREDRMPHIWCPGCGLGSVLNAFLSGLIKSELPLDKVSVISGIGCTGRTAGYVKLDSFHTTHGRAIPFATGLKLAKPRIKVFVLSGDGDIFAIGGNHFIHAARRNIDISVICVNNSVYGMTGGQAAPTTQLGDITSTTPYGNIEPPFNLVGLAAASGATYVARWPGYDTLRLQKSLRKAMNRKGFSFIEVIVPCFTQYGRRNRKEGTIEMMEWLRAIVDLRVGCPPHEAVLDLNSGLAVCGEFVETDGLGFVENLQKLRERVKERGAKKQ